MIATNGTHLLIVYYLVKMTIKMLILLNILQKMLCGLLLENIQKLQVWHF